MGLLTPLTKQLKKLTSKHKKGSMNMKRIYTFKKSHQIVKSWVSLVLSGAYSFEDVPNLFNLREVVGAVLTEVAKVESAEESPATED